MTLVLVFGIALTVAILVSGLAARTVLSTSLLFLVGGAIIGDGGLGLVELKMDSPIVARLADIALFSSLFADGMRAGLPSLRANWKEPLQALAIGMPLTFAGITLLTHFVAGFDWLPAMMVGAILSPTDPVFAAALVGRQDIPARLRHVLNVESGLNDGLALPVVVILIAVASGGKSDVPTVLFDLALGIVVGIVLPTIIGLVVRLPMLGAEPRLQPLGPFALGVTIYGTCALTHANPYLAAFAGGATLASVAAPSAAAFEELGEHIAEVGKFAALLVFGTLLTPHLFSSEPVGAYVVAALALVLVRPVSMILALAHTKLDNLERLSVAWFGPKGFASALYALLVIESGIPEGEQVFGLVAVCIAISIAVHSSSDVPVAKLFGTDKYLNSKTRARTRGDAEQD